MCDLGITPDNFNPRVLYVLKKRFNSQSVVTYHCHDFSSLIYIISGSCTYNIDNVLYPVKKGDIILCNPGIYHGRILAEEEEITEFHVGVGNLCIKNMPRDGLIPQGACPVVSMVKHEQDFSKCYNDIMSEQEKNEPGGDLVIKTLVMKLIVIFLRETYYIEKAGSIGLYSLEYYERNDLVNTIISFINENYMKNISLDKISKNMYLSPVYISRIFKEETGESPINYLIKTRLNKARDLLEEGRLSIKSVAESVGYNDAYYFSKLYKKYFGCPPSRHRL